MDKIYIDSKGKNITVELHKHGEVILIVQDGKVIRKVTTISEKI